MRHRGLRQAATPLLVSLGFAAGVAFVASCGGSGGNALAAAGGSQAVRHVYHAPVPSSHVAGGTPTVVDTVTFTPANASDVVLGVRLRGNADVADQFCTIGVSVLVPNFGPVPVGQVFLFVGSDQDFTVVAPFPTFGAPTLPATTYDFQLTVTGPFTFPPNPPPPPSNVTINALDFELIVLEDVEVSDPSPRLQ